MDGYRSAEEADDEMDDTQYYEQEVGSKPDKGS